MRIINESSRRAIAKSDLHTKPTYNRIGEFYKRDVNTNFKIIDAKVNGRIIDVFSRSIKSDVVLFTLRGNIYPTWHTIGKISGGRHSVDLSGMNVFFGIRADAEKRLTKHHLIRGDIDKIEVSTGLFGIREFIRTANSEVNIYSGAGTTTYDLTIEWQNADFLWDEPDIGSSTSLAKAISRNVNSLISLSVRAGTAGYQSNLLWQNADVNWGDDFSAIYQSDTSASISLGTSTINFDITKLIKRDASSEFELNATAGTAGYTSNLLWENADIIWQSISGGVYESSTSLSISLGTTAINYDIAKLIERNVNSEFKLDAAVGTAGYTSNLLWENADINWQSASGGIHQSDTSASISLGTSTINYDITKVISRNANSEVGLEATAGTAGYQSNLIWENADVDWQSVSGLIYESNTSLSISLGTTITNYDLAKVIERNVNTSISVSATAGTAGYESSILWENADVDWQSFSGGIYESSTSASLSMDITLNYSLVNIEVVNASANISLTTNANQTMIAGWNSETTPIENLTRNWEAT